MALNINTLGKSVRNLRNRIQIDWNHHLGRDFVPRQDKTLFLETSSICNLKCRFCAYDKKKSPRVSMEDAFFADVVEQATALDLVRFHLTPCTGDVFMDRGLFTKLAMLDQHPAVESYDFFTNFTLPDDDDIERLLELVKFKSMKISVYGHDLSSFMAITGAKEKVYRRMLANLETLLARLDRVRFQLGIGLRTSRDGSVSGPSDLQVLLQKYRDAGIPIRRTRVFNNWGGYVTSQDVEGLGIDVTDATSTYKRGACALLFTAVQVMATGVVNACACRDVDATLRIGDLNEAPLRGILSPANPAYLQVIQEQQEGQFRPVCQSCDFYKSIYRRARSNKRRGFLTLQEFLAQSAR